MDITELLSKLGMSGDDFKKGNLEDCSPVDGQTIAYLTLDGEREVEAKLALAVETFKEWREVPAPRRGELIRQWCEELRWHKMTLAELIALECGKTMSEAMGEVQEAIDICDFAVGQSRQLYGLTIASERPGHRMEENWQPLGPVAVITAFNFPLAVCSWNLALAIVCGDPVIWKPSSKAPLVAQAAKHLFDQAAKRMSGVPKALLQVCLCDHTAANKLAGDKRISLISATGSSKMGHELANLTAARLGRTILELSGNNATIVTEHADLDLALRAILFSALGTAGQRCTTLRRLIVHEKIAPSLVARLRQAYQTVRVGDPMEEGNLMGPLICEEAYTAMCRALERAAFEGGKVFGGGRVLAEKYPDAYYVRPAMVEMPKQSETVRKETFAPILYVMTYRSLDEAIALQNDVPQGLSSSIFTNDLREAERFLGPSGSDCGIANVNVGTSGSEIGGAFGGEKESGGGRESGSDAWKGYMRRMTSTINRTAELPLAQGVKFAA